MHVYTEIASSLSAVALSEKPRQCGASFALCTCGTKCLQHGNPSAVCDVCAAGDAAGPSSSATVARQQRRQPNARRPAEQADPAAPPTAAAAQRVQGTPIAAGLTCCVPCITAMLDALSAYQCSAEGIRGPVRLLTYLRMYLSCFDPHTLYAHVTTVTCKTARCILHMYMELASRLRCCRYNSCRGSVAHT